MCSKAKRRREIVLGNKARKDQRPEDDIGRMENESHWHGQVHAQQAFREEQRRRCWHGRHTKLEHRDHQKGRDDGRSHANTKDHEQTHQFQPHCARGLGDHGMQAVRRSRCYNASGVSQMSL